MKYRIVFFTCEPGGAEVLIPVIKLLQEQNRYEVVTVGYGHALERFAKKDIFFNKIPPVKKNDFTLFKQFYPDFIITSATSLPYKDMSEKYIWHNARQSGIPTFAFLDQWQNYALRFSGKTEEEWLKYLPDYLNCINDIAKREMIQEGFKPDILLTMGHPYLSVLKNDMDKASVRNIRQGLAISDSQEVVLFVSEAIYENYGNTRGYNQYEVIEDFLNYLSERWVNITVLLKLHPKEELERYRYFQKKYDELHVVIITDELSPIDCIKISNRVYGMSSLMLIEAYTFGKPVVTVQPNLKIPDPLVLSRYGYIPKVSAFGDYSMDDSKQNKNVKLDYEFSEKQFLDFLNEAISKRKEMS